MYMCTPFVTAGPELGSEQEQLWYFSHYCHELHRGTEVMYNLVKVKLPLYRPGQVIRLPRG